MWPGGVSEPLTKDQTKAVEHGKAFLVLMGEGNLAAARRALKKALRLMEAE